MKIFKTYILLIICTNLIACQSIPKEHTSGTDYEGYVNSIDSVPIFFSKKGKNSDLTLLLIHCWGCNSSYWEAQTEYFSKKYHVVTIDLAGHGKSGADRDNYSIRKYAEDVAAVINQSKLHNVILIGQSFGGAIAVEAGIMYPKSIKGIITTNAFVTDQSISENKNIEQALIPFKKNFYKATYPYIKDRFAPYTKKAMVYRIAKDIALAPPEVGLSSLRYYYKWLAHKSNQTKAKLTVPLIQIQSSKYQNNDSADILYIQSSGYYLPQEEPGKFNTALERALEKLYPDTP